MIANVDSIDIDWPKWMSFFASSSDLPEDSDPEWVAEMCRTALDIIFQSIPMAYTRYRGAKLSERVLAYCACSMVLRVVRAPQLHSETNGTYAYTRPSLESSPDLFISNKERDLLEGNGSGRGPIGTLGTAVTPMWGR